MLGKGSSPPAVTECDSALCRSDDIREQHRGQDAARLPSGTRPSDELGDRVDKRFPVAHPGDVVDSVQFNEACIGDPVSNRATLLDRDDAVTRAVEHHGGRLHQRKHLPNIECGEDVSELTIGSRRCYEPLEARPPPRELFIMAWRLEIEVLAGAHLSNEPGVEGALLVL